MNKVDWGKHERLLWKPLVLPLFWIRVSRGRFRCWLVFNMN